MKKSLKYILAAYIAFPTSAFSETQYEQFDTDTYRNNITSFFNVLVQNFPDKDKIKKSEISLYTPIINCPLEGNDLECTMYFIGIDSSPPHNTFDENDCAWYLSDKKRIKVTDCGVNLLRLGETHDFIIDKDGKHGK